MSFDPTYNPYSLVGKTILITGASSGIGRSAAIECSKLGATCILTGRNEQRLQETMSQLAGEGHQYVIADLSTQEGIDTLSVNVPVLNGVVNNAGIGYTKPIAFIRQDDLDLVFKTNAFAPILVIRSLLKKKKIAKGASLVFTSSLATLTTSIGNSVYGSAKAAVTIFMRYCARELADKQIRSNAVHPGMVETQLIHGHSITEEELQADMQKYPLKRYGQPEEIAHMMIYLLSDASAWVTGQSFVIDGGMSIR